MSDERFPNTIDKDREHRFCAHCGVERLGLTDADPCAQCDSRPQDPECAYCGYILHGLNAHDRCPECGQLIWDTENAPPTSGYAITSLVLGIVSIASCMSYGFPAIILGPLALIYAHLGRMQLREGKRAGATRSLCKSGFWTGLVGTIIGVIYVAIIAFVIIQGI
jgi:hypothetical protein